MERDNPFYVPTEAQQTERFAPSARSASEASTPRRRGRSHRECSPGLEDEQTGLPTLYTKDHCPVSPLSYVAERLGLSRGQLKHASKKGTVPAIKFGGDYFLNLRDVQAYVNAPKNKGGRPRKQPQQNRASKRPTA